jgi:transposase InsO family protein
MVHGPQPPRRLSAPLRSIRSLPESRDWCRFGGAGRSYIEPGSPWQNPFVESFGSRVRDEVLSVEAFDSVLEAQTVINDWRNPYNHKRPRRSLGWKPPAAYAASLNRQPEGNTPELS